MGPKRPSIADGAFGPPLFERDFAIGHTARGVPLQFASFVSNLSSALFQTILLIFRTTQLTAILHAGSLVSCHNCLSFLLCFNKQSRPNSSYFLSKIIVFLVYILYAEAVDAAKPHATLSASLEE
jgi:hypothetical protein